MQKNFNAIIFDLGGVLYDIDIQRSVNAFKQLGLQNFDELYSLKEQTDFFDALETGKIGREEFIKHLRKHIPHIYSDEKILDAWRALLISMPKENAELLRELKQHYRLFLLSNTNEIHMEAINNFVAENFGLPALKHFFDKAYMSFEIGMRKPGIEIYNFVIENEKLNPAETLFIDDNEDNIRGAEKAGIMVHLKTRATPLSEVIKLYRLL